jgi:hypothetical protein
MMNNSTFKANRLSTFSIAVLSVLTLFLLGGVNRAQAQWTTNGNSVTTTNNVGIGTTTPTKPLEVLAADGEAMRLYRTGYSINWGVNMKFALQNSSQSEVDYAGLHGQIANNTAGLHGGNLAFTTATSGALTEKMRITSTGNVGIGTTSPSTVGSLTFPAESKILNVYDNTNGNEAHLAVQGNVGAKINFVHLGAAADKKWIQAFDANGKLVFRSAKDDGSNLVTNNILVMDHTSGNIGIGTASPAYKLEVQGGQINSSGGLCIAGDCKTAWSQVGGGGGGGSQWTTSGSNIHYNSGNVGIGTTTPGFRFDLQGGQINASGGLCIAGDCKTAWSQVGGSTPSAANVSAGQFGQNVGGGNYSFPGNVDIAGAITWGNSNSRTDSKNDAGAAASKSGFFETASPTNYPAGASSWWHLMEARHSNNANNYALQIAGSFFDQNLYTRKTNGNASTAWSKFILQDSNNNVNLPGSGIWNANGNVGIGTTTPDSQYKLDVVGSVRVSGNIAAKYQDLAEWVESSQALLPGTVVVLDHTKSNQVVASSRAYDTRVAGVISLQPGIALGEQGEGKVLVATTGRVRIRVDATRAPIQIGDLLVTGDTEGMAIKSQPINIGGIEIHRPGTLIGKALEPLAKGEGEILVLLSLQ